MTAPVALSYLYVPGDAGQRLSRAHTRGAHALIADLEDSVAASAKPTARSCVAVWLERPLAPACEQWVRINAGAQGIDDLWQVFGPALHGVCIPKVSCPEDVADIAAALTELEDGRRRTGRPVTIMPLIETAAGLTRLPETARAPRVTRLQLGELDLAADLGLEPGADELELLPARSAVVTTSAATGLLPPLGAVSADFRDLKSFAVSTMRLRRLGFLGRAAIHPDQLAEIHGVFTPSDDELRDAHRLLAAYGKATADGHGVIVDDEGRMIDEAVVRRSRRVVGLASRAGARP